MFNPLRLRHKTNLNDSNSESKTVDENSSDIIQSKQHFKWFGQSALSQLGKLIDNSLVTVSEQLIKSIQNTTYDIDLSNARKETFQNERYVNQYRNFNQNQSPASAEYPQGSPLNTEIEDEELTKAQDIQRIKQALLEYREYKKSQNKSTPPVPKKTQPTTRKIREYPYDNNPKDNMN